ncbi:hypothetical protein DM02DRAFT_614875 [Periconia macrospinosa]|uniref:Uncharacterized protein n=1 Tax=Periconia macrospinosa TaxID=97972 RepID=A0A2V1DP45_9PLEO|nr:hypothetical protein DM02DRAFT_614875 [Periconia macrospinosa]
MLSLPTVPPRADSSLWPSLRTARPITYDDAPSSPALHQQRISHVQHDHHHHYNSSRGLLAQLTSEENKISQRKQNIQRYGATWIRPPGVLKTFQASEDEKVEREEQEALARREQVMMDLAAAQQETANAEAREDAEDMEDANEERDLDDEVPEAEADESDMSASEDESGSEAEEGDTTRHTADVTFNEDSFIEGSMLEGHVSQMLAMEEASMSGTLQEERDLDEDIPEAGSYEHTDSSLIDSSSEDEGASSAFRAPPPPQNRSRSNRRSSGTTSVRRNAQTPPQITRNSRLSVEFEGSSSILDGSSFLRSSPAAARGALRGRLFNARGGR